MGREIFGGDLSSGNVTREGGFYESLIRISFCWSYFLFAKLNFANGYIPGEFCPKEILDGFRFLGNSFHGRGGGLQGNQENVKHQRKVRN